jgi:uncharacterized protein CbrC (UPF0167 family)
VTLPSFRYHPDPLATGSVVSSEARCAACGDARGYVYGGPVYAEEDLSDALCPWCVADGSAHRRFDATFVDSEAFSEESPPEVTQVICERTPGFFSWQGERWLSCCGEPAAFLGAFGIVRIRAEYPRLEGPLMMYIVHELAVSGGEARRVLEALEEESAPTAFLFRCLHCEGTPAYVDPG